MRNCFKLALALALALTCDVASAGNLVHKTLETQIGESQHQFDLYYLKSSAKTGKLPALVLVPESWGKNELASTHAKKLANDGFAVLVVDLYGSSRHTKEASVAEEMIAEAEEATNGIDGLLGVLSEATRQLKVQQFVGIRQIGAVGFGFGGGLVYNFAKGGKSGLAAAVSFYGGTAKIRDAVASAASPKLLYVRPEHDLYTTDTEMKELTHELAKAKYPFEVLAVKGAYFGFINKNIESYSSEEGKTFMHFDRKAAEFAWTQTLRFLKDNMKAAPAPELQPLRSPASVGALRK